jgi:hypothetical protein
VPWTLIYVEEFKAWLDTQEEGLEDEALARLDMLREKGPLLGRPYADTLKGSVLSNLKELRFKYNKKQIRILFVFDHKRQAVILLGGYKQDKHWYLENIPIAEKRFAKYLQGLSGSK